jgi:hypothetical protein
VGTPGPGLGEQRSQKKNRTGVISLVENENRKEVFLMTCRLLGSGEPKFKEELSTDG